MKEPSRTVLQNVVQSHRKRKTSLSKEAAPLIYLHYLVFMKKFANSCDMNAFRYRRVQITEADVLKVADGILGAFSDAQKVRKEAAKKAPERQYDYSSGSEESDEDQTHSMI